MAMGNEVVIKIENLHKTYSLGVICAGTLANDLKNLWKNVRKKGLYLDASKNIFNALDDLNLEVFKGDTLGIIGSNGAGKSTLLKILSKVTAPTKGSVKMKGRVSSMLEVGTGFSGELTGRENVYLNGAILGMTNAEVDRKIEEIIDFSEVGQFIDTPVKRYSSGMYVKLAFAVAAHLDSDILIMDEVLAVGDMKFQQKCLGKMGDMANNNGKTVLYVSHNMNTIRQLCNRCVVLNKGKIIYDGGVDEAIGIYLGTKKNNLTYNDIKDFERKGIISRNVIFQSIELLNKATAVYNYADDINLLVEWTSRKNIDNLFLRLVIVYIDGNPVGMTSTVLPIACNENCMLNTEIKLKSKGIAPGYYYVNLIAYEKSDGGTEIIHDIVRNAISFEIMDTVGNQNNLEWNYLSFGHCRFDDMQVIDQQEIG